MSPTLMIADDDLFLRNVWAEYLRELEYSVIEVGDGNAVLTQLEKGIAPALLLLDWSLPGLNGAALLRRIAESNPKLPMVIVTGHGASVVPDRCGPMVREVLRKPFRLRTLRDAVVAACSSP